MQSSGFRSTEFYTFPFPVEDPRHLKTVDASKPFSFRLEVRYNVPVPYSSAVRTIRARVITCYNTLQTCSTEFANGHNRKLLLRSWHCNSDERIRYLLANAGYARASNVNGFDIVHSVLDLAKLKKEDSIYLKKKKNVPKTG
jgi:hypothetical protein